MDIKEIALGVAEQIDDGSGEQYFIDQDGWIAAFAEALVAEIQRQSEPVAWKVGDSLFRFEFSAQAIAENRKEAAFPLFTFPPDKAQIEQMVADACAQLYLDDYDLTDIAERVRSGDWRKFMKGE